MSDINLYSLSNKIRTILLTTIDKEILANSKKNLLLINSQNQEQLTKKFINYRDFAIESEESFEGIQNDEDNNILFDLRCIYSDNKFNYFCYISKISNKCLSFQNSIDKTIFQKKNKVKSQIKLVKDSGISENNLCKLKIDPEKKLNAEKNSPFSFNEIVSFKYLTPLNNDNKKRYVKKFSDDLYLYYAGNKNDNSLKLINYCHKLKKTNDEINNEIPDDNTSSNKENITDILFLPKIKYNQRNIPKKILKKTINKKNRVNINSHNNDDKPSKNNDKNSINFQNNEKLYFENIEKFNQNENIKIRYKLRKLSTIELKKTDILNLKNIEELHYYSKSLDQKTKEKKLEKARKSVLLVINKKQTKKNKVGYFKSIDDTLVKNKEKNDNCISFNLTNNIQVIKKNFERSQTLYKINDEFKQSEKFCLNKKILKNYEIKRNGNNKSERKNINISNINYYNNIFHRKDSIESEQNLIKNSIYHKTGWSKTKN